MTAVTSQAQNVWKERREKMSFQSTAENSRGRCRRCDRVQASRRGVQMFMPDGSAVPRWRIPPVVCCRGPSASPLCIDIIACCSTHPSFNHRLSSFSSRCCPTVEHSAAERHSTGCFLGNVWRPISQWRIR